MFGPFAIPIFLGASSVKPWTQSCKVGIARGTTPWDQAIQINNTHPVRTTSFFDKPTTVEQVLTFSRARRVV